MQARRARGALVTDSFETDNDLEDGFTIDSADADGFDEAAVRQQPDLDCLSSQACPRHSVLCLCSIGMSHGGRCCCACRCPRSA